MIAPTRPINESGAPRPLTIDVWFDVVCPFCFIGKRRLDKAIQRFRGNVEVRYHAFQLAPEAPRQTGDDLNQLLQQRYGMSRDQAVSANAQVAQAGAEFGIAFHFESAKWANTLDAHRLVKYAAEHGKAGAMVERLFAAFFEEGASIGEPTTLSSLTADIGLERDKAANMLLDGRLHTAAIALDREEAFRFGVRGVPHYRFDGRTLPHEMIDAEALHMLAASAT